MLREYSSLDLCKNLYLTDIGYFPHALNHFRKRKHGSKEYILMYCIEGFGTIHVNNKKHNLSPNSFFIVEPKKPHFYFSDEKDPWSIYWVHFSGEFSKIFFEMFLSLNHGDEINIPFERNRVAEFENIIDLLRPGFSKATFEYCNILLYKTIGSFIYYSIKSNKKNNSLNETLIEEIKAYLKENITKSVSVSEIANQFNRSNSAVFSLFKQKTGYSLIHYFNLLKIQTACELINLSNMSIKEISYQLNFQDPLYFSRLFKKFMGVLPTEYKKNL